MFNTMQQLRLQEEVKRDDADDDGGGKGQKKGGASNNDENDDDHDGRRRGARKGRSTTSILKLSSIKIHAPAAGFHLLRECYLTRSGATDNDIEKISKVCFGITTLDATGCPRVGDAGLKFLIPRPALPTDARGDRQNSGVTKKSRGSARGGGPIHGCPNLAKLFVFHTSVTDEGIAAVIASKLVVTLKHIGASEHVSSEQVAVARKRNIKVTGGRAGGGIDGLGDGNGGARGGTLLELPSSLSELFAVSPMWWEDMQDFFVRVLCLPAD